MRRREALRSGGALVIALPLVVWPLFFQRPSVEQLSADQILKKVSATYQDAQSYRFVAEKKVEIIVEYRSNSADGSRDHPNFNQSTTSEITLSAASPAKVRLTLKDENREILMVTDGQATWTYLPGKKQYMEEQVVAAKVSGQTESNYRSEADILTEYENLLVKRFGNLSIYSASAKLQKESKMKVGADKVDCYVLKVETQGGYHELWVDKDRFIVWRSIDSTPTSQDGYWFRTLVRLDLKEAGMNPKLEDSLFTFTPPENAMKVETLKGIGKKRN
jgi:outer membrane lipoprotein-sorting protein